MLTLSCFVLEIKIRLETCSCRDAFQKPCFMPLSESVIQLSSMQMRIQKPEDKPQVAFFLDMVFSIRPTRRQLGYAIPLHSKFIILAHVSTKTSWFQNCRGWNEVFRIRFDTENIYLIILV